MKKKYDAGEDISPAHLARILGEYLTPPQFARLLGVTGSTVRGWRSRGYIRAHLLPNGRYVIPSSEVERLTRPAVEKDEGE
jgi:hypothetical protein